MDYSKYSEELEKRFRNMSDEQLIDTFNGDTNKSVWITARARFHEALRKEFDNRGFDYSALLAGGGYSLKNKIKLMGKKIVIRNEFNIKMQILNKLKKDVQSYEKNKIGSGVLCIFNTVLIKFSAITKKFPGGFEGFEERYEGGFHTDGELIAFCFMGSEHYNLTNELVESGLQYSEVEHDFCFFDPPYFEFKRFKGHISTYDFIEFSWRGKDKDRRVWARLMKYND